MSRPFSFFLIIIFTVWILPLGIFVKLAQEKRFCGGQRAVCLCRHIVEKNAAAKTVWKASSGVNKEETSGGGSPQMSLLSKQNHLPNRFLSKFHSFSPIFQSQVFVRLIESVPKSSNLS